MATKKRELILTYSYNYTRYSYFDVSYQRRNSSANCFILTFCVFIYFFLSVPLDTVDLGNLKHLSIPNSVRTLFSLCAE